VVACGAPEPLYGNAAVGFWVQAFILSKIFELVDTAFIVLRKRPLVFLHWCVRAGGRLLFWGGGNVVCASVGRSVAGQDVSLLLPCITNTTTHTTTATNDSSHNTH
jgi:hypothetical protein